MDMRTCVLIYHCQYFHLICSAILTSTLYAYSCGDPSFLYALTFLCIVCLYVYVFVIQSFGSSVGFYFADARIYIYMNVCVCALKFLLFPHRCYVRACTLCTCIVCAVVCIFVLTLNAHI